MNLLYKDFDQNEPPNDLHFLGFTTVHTFVGVPSEETI